MSCKRGKSAKHADRNIRKIIYITRGRVHKGRIKLRLLTTVVQTAVNLTEHLITSVLVPERLYNLKVAYRFGNVSVQLADRLCLQAKHFARICGNKL